MRSASNPSRAMAEVVLDELARHGVTHVVIAPGSRSTALASVAHDDPRIAAHVHPDERSAAFVALGIARGSGMPCAVICTSGSAVANLHPAVVEADADRVPLLLLSADRPPELRGTGANQTIDQLHLFGRAVRRFVELGVAEDRPGAPQQWRSAVSAAVGAAIGIGGPPGPVHCNLAFREPTVDAADDGRSVAVPYESALEGRPGRAPWTASRRAHRVLADGDAAALAGRVASTERGLVVVGGGVGVAPREAGGAWLRPLLDLAAAAGWPVVAEPHSGVRRGPQALTHAPLLLSHPGFAGAHTPDLVLRVGRPTLSRDLTELLGPHVPQLLIDPDGAWLDPGRAVTEVFVADPDHLAATLARLLATSTSSQWAAAWHDADAAVAAAVAEVLADAGPVTEPGVAAAVAVAVPDGGALVVGSSLPIRHLDAHMRPRERVDVHANRGASGIDGTVSTALGVALAHGGPVVALLGDLTLLHDTNGWLLSPAVERLDLVAVVLDNDGGGIFELLPQARHVAAFERLFATPHGRDLGHLARLHGLGYGEIAATGDVGGAVGGALAAGGRHLLHVRTERGATAALHDEVRAAAHAALDRLGRA